MNGRFLLTTAAVVLSLFTACTFVMNTTPETTITAQNELRDLVATVDNTSYSIMYVNLGSITIGDVYINKLLVGDVTDAMTTGRSGDVDIDIGSATAMVAMTQGTVPITLSDIETMTTFIQSGEDNQVTFDENSAATVLASFQIPKQATITARNNLQDLVVTADGSTVNIDKIDLKDVSIGDVDFAAINAGSKTDTMNTALSGTVDIDIGSATVTVTTTQGPVTVVLPNIGVMSATILPGKVNTIIFDETSASVILATLKDYLKTTVIAKNDLTDLQVTVNGSTNDIATVDLVGVSIGDVDFTRIDAGTTTQPRLSRQSGTVDIAIDFAEATIVTTVLGQPVQTVYTFEDIDPMETIIDEYQENTVIFDATTAGNIFMALAKRLRK